MGSLPRALTVAGSDSSGGAGLAADLKTFAALGVHGMCAVTAVTAQSGAAVEGVWPLPAAAVAAQIRAVWHDAGVDAAKTGMLPSAEVAEAVSEAKLPRLVCDPVLDSSSGARLGALEALRSLVPHALVVTPNIPEAETLLGREWRDVRELVTLGAPWVLLTGGHAESVTVTDLLTDGDSVHRFDHPRVANVNTHGSGCVLSAALCAHLARGLDVVEAARLAVAFAAEAVAAGYPLGRGSGPVAPLRILEQDPP